MAKKKQDEWLNEIAAFIDENGDTGLEEKLAKLPPEFKTSEFFAQLLWRTGNETIWSFVPDELKTLKMAYALALNCGHDYSDTCPIEEKFMSVKVSLAFAEKCLEEDDLNLESVTDDWVPEPLRDIVHHLIENDIDSDSLADDYDGSDLDLDD
jgi:hypothetical protein